MNLRAVETGGLSLGKQLVRPDLKGGEPCGRPGCVLDKCSGGAGGLHNVPSQVYRGSCKLCGEEEITSEYWRESAFCGSYRSGQHENDVDAKKESNAFFKHLRLFHPDAQDGIENFDIRVNSVHKKPLTRQKTEAVKIASSTATNLLNSKAEHRQPALHIVRMVQGDDNDVQGPRHGAGGPGDGGGVGGGGDEHDQQAGHRGRRRRGE